MDGSYKIPSNFELVETAAVIVLARVETVPASYEGGTGSEESKLVSLKPIRFLKGNAAPGDLGLMGWRPPKNWEGVPTATTLWQSHFSAGLGACVRQFYEPGELVVAIFEIDPQAKEITGQELNQVFDPWARVVETVDGPDDVWVRAVERYVVLQAGDPVTIKQRIESEIQTLRSVATPEAQAIAADLQYYVHRGDRSGTWGSMSMPTFTAAGVDGQKGAQLYCIAGTPPGIMIEASLSPEPPRILVDGVPHLTMPTLPTPIEQTLLDTAGNYADETTIAQPPSLYRFSDPEAVDALSRAARDVRIDVGGKTIIQGQPLDALLRWASQCEKLQTLPRPIKTELP